MLNVLVVGGGAAGMMAAIFAARSGAKVTLWEKNTSLGKKLLITGKGRCNVTNAGSIDEIVQNLIGNGKFMYSALNAFTNEDVMDFFTQLGVALKVERGKRVFPVSDKSGDIVESLQQEMLSLGVKIKYNTSAEEIIIIDNTVKGAKSRGICYDFDKVILATGGCTYKQTGSDGSGYDLASGVGHKVTPIRPALVPLISDNKWIPELAGLSLKNVKASIWRGDKKLGEEFGEMLFTHKGLSGPIILSLSEICCKHFQKNPQEVLKVLINLKPALTPEQLDLRLQRDFQKYSRKHLLNACDDLLPKSLIPIIIMLSAIPPHKPVHEITKEERLNLRDLILNFPVQIVKAAELNEGIVTAGGISLKEVNPKTFESKLISGLYITGELLDIHGFTGGYNLQAAFSSGYVAGTHSAGL